MDPSPEKSGLIVWSVSWQAYTDHSRHGSSRTWRDDEEQSERARRLLGDRYACSVCRFYSVFIEAFSDSVVDTSIATISDLTCSRRRFAPFVRRRLDRHS